MSEGVVCPLCAGPVPSTEFHRDKKGLKRSYLRCETCELVFVPAAFHLSEEAEKREYELHDNNPEDVRYRGFLSRATTPLLAMLTSEKPCEGLDFGCGPGPTLHLMLQEHGHKMSLYDKYYFPDPEVWGREYDFITATSVVGHLAHCGDELDRLWAHIRPGGYLVVMTKRVESLDRFAQWHYKNDPTHVCFFHINTMQWLARKWKAKDVSFPSADVVIFLK